VARDRDRAAPSVDALLAADRQAFAA
jgi:hypothetical protein